MPQTHKVCYFCTRTYEQRYINIPHGVSFAGDGKGCQLVDIDNTPCGCFV